MSGVGEGDYKLSLSQAGLSIPSAVARPGGAPVKLKAEARPVTLADLSGNLFLSMLPENQEKRLFLLDCSGCHVFDARIAYPDGNPRSQAGWQEKATQMHQLFGPRSGFPIISARMSPEQIAAYLSQHIRGVPSTHGAPVGGTSPRAGSFQITEYEFPDPRDLPHDVAIDRNGQVVITGMFTHVMQVLDPQTGAFRPVPIPVQGANPRALEIDAKGVWWVALGNPHKVARFDPAATQWRTWDVGVYAHSIALTSDGRAWFNGHFTRTPSVIGRVGLDAEMPERFEVPAHPEAHVGAGPIPYEIRAAANGRVWGSELIGNRVFEFDTQRRTFRVWNMPTPNSGPRRLDIGPDGIRSDSGIRGQPPRPTRSCNGRDYRIRIPGKQRAAVCNTGGPAQRHRLDRNRSCRRDLRLRSRTRGFTKYPLPTRGALVRHIAIGPDGSVWAAYGASPGIPNRIARLQVRTLD